MKVLHLNSSDILGGAARAANRLHCGLRQAGVESYMLVRSKYSSDPTVFTPDDFFYKAFYKAIDYLDQRQLSKYPRTNNFSVDFSLNSHVNGIIRKIDPDIIVVHWIRGFINIETLTHTGKPVVWNLHDMWAFTGGCHYDEHCNQFTQACGSCPVLKSQHKKDLSSRIFHLKEKVYPRIRNFSIVGLSKWMAETASQSSLLKNYPVYQLPNGIDTNVFKPYSKQQARNRMQIPPNRKVVLFGASWATGDARKGFKYILEALDVIPYKDFDLLVFGHAGGDFLEQGIRVHFVGNIDKDESLAMLYSSADVMVVPSLQENLSNTIMESLACGVPVVAFNIGGNKDMIDHKVDGYLAKPFNAEDLAEGIRWILTHEEIHRELSKNARKKILDEFDLGLVSMRYIELYNHILTRRKDPGRITEMKVKRNDDYLPQIVS